MPKRYKITLSEGSEFPDFDLYDGQIWRSEGLSDYRKITKISNRKDQRLKITYTSKESPLETQDCDLDDFVMWVLDEKAQPMVVSYVEAGK
jgi:hypothetical protein